MNFNTFSCDSCSTFLGYPTGAVAFFIFLLVCAAIATKRKPKGPKARRPVHVEVFGDSIMTGPFLDRSPVAQMRLAAPGWIFTDHSISGLALRSLVRGLQTEEHSIPKMESRSFVGDFVVIEPGGNDALGQLLAEDFKADLLHAIALVTMQGKTPVLTGIVDLPVGSFVTLAMKSKRDEFDAITRDVAKEHGLAHAQWGDNYLGPEDCIDGIHRTQEASDSLALSLIAALRRKAPLGA